MRCSFGLRPDSRALGTAGSVMTIGLSVKDDRSQKKPVSVDGKTRLTSLEARAAATSKIDAIHAELSFFLLLVPEEVKRRLG